jgi:hypothetical protein
VDALSLAIEPLKDPRWAHFVESHPGSSVFHTTAWLEALYRTYGYSSVVYTDEPPGVELKSGVPFCHINSWLTGSRFVSVPFADHCEPLVESPTTLIGLCSRLLQPPLSSQHAYVEMRPLQLLPGLGQPWEPGSVYHWHRIDLSPSLPILFRNCHRDSVQRKIRRAEREHLQYESGRSEALLTAFYRLLLLTRRRHGIPPQPITWFRNLIACFGNALTIRVASMSGQPAAAILTLRHKNTLVYKYGCSDVRMNKYGGTHLLFWRAIEEAKEENLLTFDLGRTDIANEGLTTFKNRWGAISEPLIYHRLPLSVRSDSGKISKMVTGFGKKLLPYLPDTVFVAIGELLYRHAG